MEHMDILVFHGCISQFVNRTYNYFEISIESAKLWNLNVYPLEVVSRYREPQLLWDENTHIVQFDYSDFNLLQK